MHRITLALLAAGFVTVAAAVDVDAALDAAKKPKQDADKAEVSGSAKEAQADMQRRIDALNEERVRRRDDMIRKLTGPATGGAQPAPGAGAAGIGYRIHRDKGQASPLAWYRQEVVLQCTSGPATGQYPSIYLTKSGRWNTGVWNLDSFQEAAVKACERP